jgi:hypothetical protein
MPAFPCLSQSKESPAVLVRLLALLMGGSATAFHCYCVRPLPAGSNSASESTCLQYVLAVPACLVWWRHAPDQILNEYV